MFIIRRSFESDFKEIFNKKLAGKAEVAYVFQELENVPEKYINPERTKPWGTGQPKLADVAAPSQEMRDSELLYNEPKYVRMDDGGLHTLESNGLSLKEGVYY